MWINAQIGGKNMTGRLQNHCGFNFFLSVVSAAFHAIHVDFLLDVKWFILVGASTLGWCEYHERRAACSQVFVWYFTPTERHL